MVVGAAQVQRRGLAGVAGIDEGAGLFARSLYNLLRVDPGFRTERLLTFAIDPSLNGYAKERGFALFRDLQERIARLPGVVSAGAASPGPLTGSNRGSGGSTGGGSGGGAE